MKTSQTKKRLGRWLPWLPGICVPAGIAGTLFALNETLEIDTDGDGWTDADEIIAGTDVADPTNPWDSDEDGIADYLEHANGTDPLDPFDPPRALRAVLARNASAGATFFFPSLISQSQQNMWHNTAWFGSRLNYVFYTPSPESAWQPVTGTEIEYWESGYYDLLARNGSSGIQITLSNLPAGDYRLSWQHMRRPDGGNSDYTVEISGEASATSSFTAPTPDSPDDAREASLRFTLPQAGNVVVKFLGGSGTSGALVGGFLLGNPVSVAAVNFKADSGKFEVTQDSGEAFSGSAWDCSRERKTHPVAFRSGTAFSLVPSFTTPALALTPTHVRAEITPEAGKTPLVVEAEYSTIEGGLGFSALVPAGEVNYFESANVVWSLRYAANGEWESAGTSSHEIYYILGTPQSGLQQETLYWVACSGAKGKTDQADIIDGIWSKFSSGNGPANLTRRDGTPMKYWGEEAVQRAIAHNVLNAQKESDPGNSELVSKSNVAEEELLDTLPELLTFADGQCGAWAKLLCMTGQLNQIALEEIVIVPEDEKDKGFLVKNYEARDPVLSDIEIAGDYKYVIYSSEKDFLEKTSLVCYILMDLPGVIGQSNLNPHSAFKDHVVVYFEGHLYDPSYGTRSEKFDNIDRAIEAWGKSYISGFVHTTLEISYPLIDGNKDARPACRLYSENKKSIKRK